MTTTSDKAERGLALYLEFRATADPMQVGQFIVIPEMVSPVTNEVIGFRFLSRVISPKDPQRIWRPVFYAGKYQTKATVKNGKFDKKASLAEAVTVAASYLSEIQGSLDSMATGGWTLHERPLVLGISDADAADIEKLEAPRLLIDRLRRLRDAESFDPLPKAARSK